MKVPAKIAPLLFVPYAVAVWLSAYRAAQGSDVIGFLCFFLLLIGGWMLVYAGFLRRTVSLGLSSLIPITLSLLGFAFGTIISGETIVGIVVGFVTLVVAAITSAAVAARERRRPRSVFLSYRRADSGDIAPQIRDRLARRFGEKNIFMDINAVELGGRFKEEIADAVTDSDALVAVIGEQWLTLKDAEGRRRIDTDDDLVRFEIETALRSPRILVVPLAVRGARIPERHELPPSIQDLAARNGGVLRDPPDFESDMARLAQRLEKGSIGPWSIAASKPVPWRRIIAYVGVLLVPFVWALLEELTADSRKLIAATFSPTRAIMATSHGVGLGVRKRVRLWDAVTGATLHTIRTNVRVGSIAWSPDGAFFAYGDDDGTLTILNAETWQERHRFKQHDGMLEQIAWAPDGNRVATGDRSGRLRVWSVQSGELRFTAYPHIDGIEMVGWSPSGDRIASASRDRTVVITESAGGALLHRIPDYTASVNCVAWSPDGQTLASASFAHPYLLLSDARSGGPVKLVGYSGSVETVAWSPSEPLLATAGRSEPVRIWNAAGTLRQEVKTEEQFGVADISWSPDGKLLAIADEKTLSIWNSATGVPRHRAGAHGNDDQIRIVGWWPDSRRVVTAGGDGTVKVWEVDELRAVASLRVGVGVLPALLDKLF